MAAAQASRGGKGGVRKVNKAASKGYRLLIPEGKGTAAQDRTRQSSSDRSKAYNRAKVQQKRDAVKRGAEGPKKSMPRKKAR